MANRIAMPSKEEMRTLFEAEFSGEKARYLPKAVGWRMLIMMPKPKTETAGGIALPDEYVQQEIVAAPIGYVVEQGSLCYSDSRKFPDGKKWCEVGDVVFFRSYVGTRVVIKGIEFRFICDDSVESVVDDPRGIERI